MPFSDLKIVEPLVKVNKLVKYFPARGTYFQPSAMVRAVNEISFSLREGETYGLVGESGCGKSTTGRMILRLIEPTSGEVFYQGRDILKLDEPELQKIRKQVQIVFQDPFSALNPRIRIGDAIREPLNIYNIGSPQDRKGHVCEILSKVGLQIDHYDRYPHEFSGGQRQRIVLARALSVQPKFVVLDEPVSALDVSTQSQIINLLRKIQDGLQLTYLFISHNLSVIRHISDRIGVMYLGHILEEADTDSLFSEPQHPYTQALLSAIPHSNPTRKRSRIVLNGDVPSPLNMPSGCVFHTRCPIANEKCKEIPPALREIGTKHKVACHLHV
ncbi:MAG: dipeptide ABC transporter ATP-binding protein [Veillonellales bacterium]